MIGLRVLHAARASPECCQRTDGELRSVVGHFDGHVTPVGSKVEHTVWHSHALAVATEVVVVDFDRLLAPGGTGVLEQPDEFLFLGVDADDGQIILTQVFGPVEGDHVFLPFGHEPWSRSHEAILQNEACIAQQAIDLLDPVLRTCASHAGHRTTDLRDAEALGEDDPDRRERDRSGPLLAESQRQEIHDEIDYLIRYDREITDAFLLMQPPKPSDSIRSWRREWPSFC